VIAVWIPVTVVPTSFATLAMATFITDMSNVIRNCPDASVTRTRPTPAAEALEPSLATAADLTDRGEPRRETHGRNTTIRVSA
jgi:hypothetical protein